jgi:hypothetical protein
MPRPADSLLRAIVGHAVPEADAGPYLAFAREFQRSLRRLHRPFVQSDLWTLTSGYSRIAKPVIRKWFQRGLSGKALWTISRELLGRRQPPRMEEKHV